jgi:hypothetical protein
MLKRVQHDEIFISSGQAVIRDFRMSMQAMALPALAAGALLVARARRQTGFSLHLP